MAQVLERKTWRTSDVATSRFGRRQTMVTVAIVAVVAGALAAIPVVSNDAEDVAATVKADAARWQALAAAEYPAAAPGVRAQAERWTALAAAYQSRAILTAGQQADQSRWEAIAASHLRAQTAATARWTGLADHHAVLSRADRAWADRYQGLADLSG